MSASAPVAPPAAPAGGSSTPTHNRVRVRYTKDGRTRFVSARDLSSVWQRALRRAALPIAYSEGFSPHPKVSFPDALAVGVASTGEYAELTFTEGFDLRTGLATLSATMPAGMRVLTYHQVEDGSPKLARLLEATLWEIEYPQADDADAATQTTRHLGHLARQLMAAEAAPVRRSRPDGETRTVDIRPTLVVVHAARRGTDAQNASAPTIPTIRAILSNDGPSIRPGDLHQALTAYLGPDDEPIPQPRLLRRVAQGRPVEPGLREALSGEIIPLVPEDAL